MTDKSLPIDISSEKFAERRLQQLRTSNAFPRPSHPPSRLNDVVIENIPDLRQLLDREAKLRLSEINK